MNEQWDVSWHEIFDANNREHELLSEATYAYQDDQHRKPAVYTNKKQENSVVIVQRPYRGDEEELPPNNT